MTFRERVIQALKVGSPSFAIFTPPRTSASPLPAIVVTIVTSSFEEGLSEDAGDDLLRAHVQIDAYATTQIVADSVTAEVRALMLGASLLQCHTLEAGVDTYEDESGLYRVRSEYSVRYNTVLA